MAHTDLFPSLDERPGFNMTIQSGNDFLTMPDSGFFLLPDGNRLIIGE